MLENFRSDTRAIEGLPVRLVVALVVGVASLSVMLNMISGIHGLAVTELGVRPSPDVVTPGEQTVEVTVVDPEGSPVSGATVIVRSDTARIDGVVTAKTNADGVATVTVAPHLGPNQSDGTLEVDVKPPAGHGQFVDRRENTKVLVVES
ncbi:MAG: Ig-like domain-containing protein [Haloferacaceae archaeon]